MMHDDQCSVRGTESVNDGMGASNVFPSSPTIWYAPRIVPTGVGMLAPLVYSNFSPGFNTGCCPMTPNPFTS